MANSRRTVPTKCPERVFTRVMEEDIYYVTAVEDYAVDIALWRNASPATWSRSQFSIRALYSFPLSTSVGVQPLDPAVRFALDRLWTIGVEIKHTSQSGEH